MATTRARSRITWAIGRLLRPCATPPLRRIASSTSGAEGLSGPTRKAEQYRRRRAACHVLSWFGREGTLRGRPPSSTQDNSGLPKDQQVEQYLPQPHGVDGEGAEVVLRFNQQAVLV